jgi:hypothetical protein
MNTKELEKARVGVTNDIELSNLNPDEDNNFEKSAFEDMNGPNNGTNEIEKCCCQLMHIKVRSF